MPNIYIALGYIIDEFIETYYGMQLFPYKTENKRKNTILIFMTRLIVKVLLLPISDRFVWKVPIIFLAQWMIYNHFYDAKKISKFVALTSYFVYGLVGEVIISLISMYILNMDYADIMQNPICSICAVVLVYTVIAVLCAVTILLVNKSIKHTPITAEYLIVATAIFIFISSLNLYFIILYIYSYNEIPFIALAITTCVGNIISFIFLYKHFMRQRENWEETTFMHEQTKLQQQHYEELKQKYVDIRRLQHDFKNHLQTIQILNNNHANEEMSHYIDDLSIELIDLNKASFCNNVTIDSVLYNKKQSAENNNIKIEIASVPLDDITLPTIDLCSIIYNLLDNAIESCKKEKENRYIYFDIYKKGIYLIFECRNSCSRFEPKTQKKDKNIHGFGLKIIKNIAQKYNGNDYYTISKNEFIHIVNIAYL